jgi:hypothetical protein
MVDSPLPGVCGVFAIGDLAELTLNNVSVCHAFARRLPGVATPLPAQSPPLALGLKLLKLLDPVKDADAAVYNIPCSQ